MSQDTDSFLMDLVLVVVDMQPTMLAKVDPDRSLLRRTCFAVKCANLMGVKVVFSEQVPDKLGPTASELLEAADSGDRSSADSVFAKTHFSALSVPRFNSILQDRGKQHILLAGIETPICIYQTAVEAINRDYQVTLLTDCIGGRRAPDCDWALRSLAQSGAIALPSETIFYSIIRSAEHPAFRQFTTLVKTFSA